MPSLTQLEYIIAVDRLKHFAKAAEACHVSQPSLSMQIQKAEDELGVIIFDRLKKPVLTTSKGQKVISQAKKILEEYKILQDLSRHEANSMSGELRLAIIPTLTAYILPLFLKSFSKQYPKVQLRIDELKTSDIIEALKDDRIDAAILATPLGERDLDEDVLFYEPFYLYHSSDSPLAQRKTISEKDIDPKDLWLLQDGHCFKNQVISYCAIPSTELENKNVLLSGGSFETLRKLIQTSGGVTFFPALFVHQLAKAEVEKHVKPFHQPRPSREVSLVYRRSQYKQDILSALKTLIVQQLPKDLKSNNQRLDVLDPLDS